MQCDYYDAGVCRSCTLMGTAYSQQLATKDARCRDALSLIAPQLDWLEPFASAEHGFRNKAKLVVGGTASAPTLGILDGHGRGVDLRDCGLYEPALHAALPHLADFVMDAQLTPYDVPQRRGELKYLLVTASPAGALMLRIVLRSNSQLPQARSALPRLQAALPHLQVVTVNLHPQHKAVLEGDTELVLTKQSELSMPVADAELHLGPRSFFQTNTAVAAGLYLQAQAWIDAAQPASVLDLYCGVGGFALQAAAAGRHVIGVEVSADAITAAQRSAAGLLAQRPDCGPIDFVVGDATAYAIAHPAPDLVVVNPPRRGLDESLTSWLEASAVRDVVYSSCNVTTLARDLAKMPSLIPHQARLFDMFPQTDHHEVMVWLRRGPNRHA
ncbi:MAG TPA: 23S rRNA (uracil(747)-C(5))-methyltransferase RlmC [Dermatophilaceae bacterium]|nr:23S rRNA (uracil(747)-C(5))-methyltransferase RlmC [Dermatophilaceae bacterium]